MPIDPMMEDLVLSDLAFLGSSWQSPTTNEISIKRESAVLRRLLIDGGGLLQRYRRMKGMKREPRIRAVTLAAAIPRPWDNILVASAGGANVGGINLLLPQARTRSMPEPPPVPFPTKDYRLSDFLSVPAMIVAGAAVNRRDLLKYVANKLGGVHYDTRRKPHEKLFKLLDNNRDLARMMDGIDLVHFEVLAIGQHLLRSSDVATLLPEELRPSSLPDLDQIIQWRRLETLSADLGRGEPDPLS